MKKHIFSGVGTALVTPFCEGKIDFNAITNLIEFQIRGGVSALVIGGTTGEAATLSDEERYELFSFTKDAVRGRCKLVFGTGTNDTKVALRHTKMAEKIGCDGALLVTPYYNKGTEDGIVAHYEKIASETELPIILYNVPGRTGVNISMKSLEKLSMIQNIVGIKEAADSADRLVELSRFGDDLRLYAGNDSQLFTSLALGGCGVISVVSNLLPRETSRIWQKFISGEWQESLELQIKLLPLIHVCFLETNPAPIKFMLSEIGLCKGDLRLPLCEIGENNKKIIQKIMADFKP
jgi:4-hydroxy-tetrahydrodipicolinate synthase